MRHGQRSGVRRRRAAALATALVILTAIGQSSLVALAAPPVDLPGPPSADGVQPVIRETRSSSDECAELGFDHGLSPARNGHASSGDLVVSVSGYNSPPGFLDWSSNLPIHAVYVKGGPSGGNLFSYPAGDSGDQDLHTPQKLSGSGYSASHVALCWDDVEAEPDVTVAKANDPTGAVVAGDPIAYALTVANEGDTDAAGVVVTDELPPGVSFGSATAGCGEAAGTVTCSVGDVGPGAHVDIEITVSVDEGTCGPISNAASVTASNEPAAATGNNDSNEVSNTAECAGPLPPEVEVSKTSSADGILGEGEAFAYTITVTNVGDEEATGVRFIDSFPAGDPLSVDLSPFPTFDGKPCTIASSQPGGRGGTAQTTLHCGPISLVPGASRSITVGVEVNGSNCGAIVNQVDVEAANEPAEHVGPDNHAEAPDEIACPPRIRIVKDGADIAHVGDPIAYGFVVTNTGAVDLTDVGVTDPTCDGPIDLVDGGDGDAVLAAGEGWRFGCVHTITEGDGDPARNTATVAGRHPGGTVTDSDGHTIDVLHPAIALDTSASPISGTTGTTIVYTYVVTNTGDTTLFDVSIDDDLLGHIGEVASLAPGTSATLTEGSTLGATPMTNIGTTSGSDVLGRDVSAEDVVSVIVVSAGGSGGGLSPGGSAFTGPATGRWIVLAGLWLATGLALLVGTRPRAHTPG